MENNKMEVRVEDVARKKGMDFIRELGNVLRKYDIRDVRINNDYDGNECIKFTGLDLDIYAQFIEADLTITEADVMIQPKKKDYEWLYFNAQNGRRMINRKDYFPEES